MTQQIRPGSHLEGEALWHVLVRILLIAAVLLSAPVSAMAAKRVALVIGNDNYSYKTLPDLNNARRDARGMAARLKQLGFKTFLHMDADRRRMWDALDEFEGALQGAEVGLVFYAGHGIAAQGRNWLIPADAKIDRESHLRAAGIAAQELVDTMTRAGTALKIVILDACRDNPLPRRNRSAARGLVIEATPAVSGTAIIYSAGQGQAAQDGAPGKHGVFTGQLLKLLGQPGLDLGDVFRRTAKQVSLQTGGQQTPWFHSSVTDEFYFQPAQLRPTPAPQTTAAVTSDQVTQNMLDLQFWQDIKHSTEPAAFKEYLRLFPQGSFAFLARQKIKQLPAATVAGSTAAPRPPQNTPPSTADIAPRHQIMQVAGSSAVNVRAAPSTRAVITSRLTGGHFVDVTGKTIKTNWYRVKMNRGRTGYVYGPLLTDKIPPDIIKLVRECRAENGSSCLSLGRKYYYGKELPQDYARALSLFTKACDKGRMLGCVSIGMMYEHARGVKRDYTQARIMFEKACNGNNLRGCVNLGNLYVGAEGVKRNYARALELFRAACVGGEIAGCGNLGYMYAGALGVKRDYRRAREFYDIACEHGQETSCYNLAGMYRNAQGVDRDLVKARELYRKSCKPGFKLGCGKAEDPAAN